jgi:hypothetical protein
MGYWLTCVGNAHENYYLGCFFFSAVITAPVAGCIIFADLQ